jgi:hypothetical protein
MKPSMAAGLLAVLALAALAAGAVAIRSYDFGWHVGGGEWTLDHGGRPPQTDPLAHTTGDDTPWVDYEWLFQALLAGLVRAGGTAAAWGLKQAMVVLAILVSAVWLVRRGLPAPVVAILGSLALFGARFRFFARPELAGMLLTPVLLILLIWARRRARDRLSPLPPLLPLPLLFLLWVNLHLSVLLGLALLWLFSLAVILEKDGDWRPGPAFLMVSGASTAALLANPYGGHLLLVPLRIRSALAGSELSNPEWGSAVRAEFWFFWLVAALIGVALGMAMRHRVRLAWPVVGAGLLLAVAGSVAFRLLGLFFMALPVLVGGVVEREQWRENESRWARLGRGGRLAALVIPLASAVYFVLLPEGGPLGTGLAPGRFPEAMVRTYRQAGVRGPLYNPVRFGGYLAWQLSPEKVFIDGRNDVHAELLARLAECRMATDLHCWDSLLAEHGVEAAIVQYDPRRIPVRLPDGRFESRNLGSVYFRRDLWALVDWDDTAMLLVRRGGVNDPLPSFPEDRLLLPEDPEQFARKLEAGRIDPAEALVEVRRRLSRHPGSERARLLEHLTLSAAPSSGSSREGDRQPAPDAPGRLADSERPPD